MMGHVLMFILLIPTSYAGICSTFLDQTLWNSLSIITEAPYSYSTLCDAIDAYNSYNTVKFLGGTISQNKAELAAFLANTDHESQFKYAREIACCADFANGQCNPTAYCSPFTHYCQNPTASSCKCSNPSGPPYDVTKMFFGRGAIQLSWNYNYASASEALTGNAATLCNNPDLVATEGKYAWGAAVWFWMTSVGQVGKTCHQGVLDGDFGTTVNVINGGKECPCNGCIPGSITQRAGKYCHFASLLGTPILSYNGCSGLAAVANGASECNGGVIYDVVRCGASWADANGKCGSSCTLNSDCPGTDGCFSSLSTTPCTTNGQTTAPTTLTTSVIRCGVDWTDANGKCGTPCTLTSDCPGNEVCYASLSITPCTTNASPTKAPTEAPATSPASVIRCGLGWSDANAKCGTSCPSGTNAECVSPETCFNSLDLSVCANQAFITPKKIFPTDAFIAPPTEPPTNFTSTSKADKISCSFLFILVSILL